MTLSDAFDDTTTADTLLITVQSDDDPDRFAFESSDLLFETFNPRTMALLETIADAAPESIRETARLVDRDVKNVHEELSELEQLGVIRFETSGRAKQPIFPYEEIVISLPFDHDRGRDAAQT